MFGFRGVFARKPRQFEYKPLYYDPEKEAREERRRQLRGESPEEEEREYTPGMRIRGHMGAYRRTASARDPQRRRVRLIAFLVALLCLAVWMML